MIEFDFDEDKARENLRKHGVSFDEAVTSFFDPRATSDFDEQHSVKGDERFINIGLSVHGRLLFVVHNEEDAVIRIITARVASPAQREHYEEA